MEVELILSTVLAFATVCYTIINLMMRMYDADQGRILISGRDVRTYKPEELKSRFGVVFQNDTIFEDTIAGNVTLGRELDETQVQEALLYARAREFVEDRTDREEEALNIKGANLSGGQKQRVLIARALAAKPRILILDDSSSALDYKTDRVREAEELIRRYRRQLELYGEALERTRGKRVKERYLYSFALGETIRV